MPYLSILLAPNLYPDIASAGTGTDLNKFVAGVPKLKINVIGNGSIPARRHIVHAYTVRVPFHDFHAGYHRGIINGWLPGRRRRYPYRLLGAILYPLSKVLGPVTLLENTSPGKYSSVHIFSRYIQIIGSTWLPPPGAKFSYFYQ